MTAGNRRPAMAERSASAGIIPQSCAAKNKKGGDAKRSRSFELVEEPFGFFDKKAALRSAPQLPAKGGQFDARSAGSIFSDVHAAGENDKNSFAPPGAKLCEAFSTD